MKTLIVEDDLASRRYLNGLLRGYGPCDLAVDGIEAINAFQLALGDKDPYHLICLDIMMPKIDGIKVLKAIRSYENQQDLPLDQRVKVILVTALGDTALVKEGFNHKCDGYLSKPVSKEALLDLLQQMQLIPE